MRFVELCQRAAAGDVQARRYAKELDEALAVLSKFDEGPDLVLYYKYLMVLEGHPEYELQIYSSDRLSDSQREYVRNQWHLFRSWWDNWPGASDQASQHVANSMHLVASV